MAVIARPAGPDRGRNPTVVAERNRELDSANAGIRLAITTAADGTAVQIEELPGSPTEVLAGPLHPGGHRPVGGAHQGSRLRCPDDPGSGPAPNRGRLRRTGQHLGRRLRSRRVGPTRGIDADRQQLAVPTGHPGDLSGGVRPARAERGGSPAGGRRRHAGGVPGRRADRSTPWCGWELRSTCSPTSPAHRTCWSSVRTTHADSEREADLPPWSSDRSRSACSAG